jgi:methionine-rich copper-binding protein CopC
MENVMLKPILAGIAVTLLSTQMGVAHALLKSSVPARGATVAPPQHVMLTFDGKVRVTNLKLTNAGKDTPLPFDRAAAPTETVHVPVQPLAPGAYTVTWTVIGEDGHPMDGRLRFTVAAGK